MALPPQTLYLIDKVVRAKALYGPIGVDNSEFINIEMERDLRKRNRYIAGLYGEKAPTEEGGEDEGEFLDGAALPLYVLLYHSVHGHGRNTRGRAPRPSAWQSVSQGSLHGCKQ